MPRPARRALPDRGVFHVTARGVNRSVIAFDDIDHRRHNRTGHLFENRFSARLVTDEDHWRETCRYVLENPVKAGLCVSALDWPWSGGRYLREYRP